MCVGRNIIENRVRITNGTATVSEETHIFGANRSLEQSEKAGCELLIRKSGELLRRFSMNLQVRKNRSFAGKRPR